MAKRRDWKKTLAGALVGCALIGLGSYGYFEAGAMRFDRRYPGFIDQNRTLRRYWLSRPPGHTRDEALKTVEANLQWASEYQRLGFDPGVLDEMAFEEELEKQGTLPGASRPAKRSTAPGN